MRLFNASHLEVKKNFTEDFKTDPYEAGWAKEGIFFIMVEELSGDNPKLSAEVQISHDGVNWAKEGTFLDSITEKALHFIRVKHFGNWLRLSCQIRGKRAIFRLNIQIALKS